MTDAHPSFINPLASVTQLEASSSSYDGVPEDLERSIRYAAAKLMQAAGVLLRLPQDLIASAIVTFTRFWIGAEGGSLREYGARDISTACIYLATNASPHPRSARSILNVYAYLQLQPSADSTALSPEDVLSEGDIQRLSTRLFSHQVIILRTMGFTTKVALPYTLCVNYIQALGVFQASTKAGQRLARRAFRHMNSALLSPQLLYLTHQPPALATAAVYLAAREEDVKLPSEAWWEVFDTDREELGFLVVALLSLEGFARSEEKAWEGKDVPMTVKDLEMEMERRRDSSAMDES